MRRLVQQPPVQAAPVGLAITISTAAALGGATLAATTTATAAKAIAMTTLAGLQSIKYVLVYPETGDIVLAGPAGDWARQPNGTAARANSSRRRSRFIASRLQIRRPQFFPE